MKSSGPLSRDYAELAPKPPPGAIDLPDLFPGAAEIEFEIGFGKGRFLLERARGCPTLSLLGIEIRPKWAYLVDQRRAKEGLKNARVLTGDAREIVPRIGPDGSVRRIFLHFPDPWWKKRHAKRRVMKDALVGQIARLLAPGGEIFLQTDVEDRAAAYLELLRKQGQFKFCTADGFVGENPFGARSNREVQAEKYGLPIYRILAQRI